MDIGGALLATPEVTQDGYWRGVACNARGTQGECWRGVACNARGTQGECWSPTPGAASSAPPGFYFPTDAAFPSCAAAGFGSTFICCQFCSASSRVNDVRTTEYAKPSKTLRWRS